MMIRVAEIFGDKDSKEKLQLALECEDYEDEEFLTLIQIKETIQSEYENLDDSIMDYLLYYTYIRSKSDEQMEYKHILNMLDESMKL